MSNKNIVSQIAERASRDFLTMKNILHAAQVSKTESFYSYHSDASEIQLRWQTQEGRNPYTPISVSSFVTDLSGYIRVAIPRIEANLNLMVGNYLLLKNTFPLVEGLLPLINNGLGSLTNAVSAAADALQEWYDDLIVDFPWLDRFDEDKRDLDRALVLMDENMYMFNLDLHPKSQLETNYRIHGFVPASAGVFLYENAASAATRTNGDFIMTGPNTVELSGDAGVDAQNVWVIPGGFPAHIVHLSLTEPQLGDVVISCDSPGSIIHSVNSISALPGLNLIITIEIPTSAVDRNILYTPVAGFAAGEIATIEILGWQSTSNLPLYSGDHITGNTVEDAVGQATSASILVPFTFSSATNLILGLLKEHDSELGRIGQGARRMSALMINTFEAVLTASDTTTSLDAIDSEAYFVPEWWMTATTGVSQNTKRLLYRQWYKRCVHNINVGGIDVAMHNVLGRVVGIDVI
jgi:hypothetical protein